jgi:hypothetical protein
LAGRGEEAEVAGGGAAEEALQTEQEMRAATSRAEEAVLGRLAAMDEVEVDMTELLDRW